MTELTQSGNVTYRLSCANSEGSDTASTVVEGCTPASCGSLGVTCGYYADGCGNTLNCGSCACTREAVDTGATGAGSGRNEPPGTKPWSNPTRIRAGASGAATVRVSPSSSSQYLVGSNYGFALPPHAEITGVKLSMSRQGSGDITDSTVRLRLGAKSIGNNHGLGSWSPSPMRQTRIYGGPTDLWGTALTPVDVNRADFNVMLRVRYKPLSGNADASVYAMPITIYYTQCVP